MKDCKHTFVNVLDGTTIHGTHIHVYQCVACDVYDVGEEK